MRDIECLDGAWDVFSQEGLKLVACVTMLIDHVGAVFFPKLLILREIGRIAFPIFCFLITEGFHYTHDRRYYLLRLCFCILLSELPFDFALRGYWDWGHQNVMFTLALGLSALLFIEQIENPWLKLLGSVPFVYIAQAIHTDYGGWGVALIVLLGVARTLPKGRILQYLIIALMCATKKSRTVSFFGLHVYPEFYGILCVLAIALYSGRKSTKNREIQWEFYLFYPVHLTIIALIRFMRA